MPPAVPASCCVAHPSPPVQPKFLSIAEQTAQALRAAIAGGDWHETMPSERQLVEQLNVSRKTLRKALTLLRTEGVLRPAGRRPAKIVRSGRKRFPQTDRVVLLLPYPPEAARPFTLLWINRLMRLLHNSRLFLEVVHGPQYFSKSPEKSLAKLTAATAARCWVIAATTRPLQAWFSASGLPTLIAGAPHQGIRLPSVDSDHFALCRHAAITMLRRGHQRIAMLMDVHRFAGDEESERGFVEGWQASGTHAQPPTISRIARDPATIIRELRRLLASNNAPTALFLFTTDIYLTVATYLGSKGINVPRDISLVCRDEEPFLRFIHPPPTRYLVQPAHFASKLSQAVRRIAQGDQEPFTVRVMPTFVLADSLTPYSPAAGSSTPA